MREAAVVREPYHRTLQAPEDIKIWRFSSQRHRCGSQRSFAIKSCPRQDSARQKMCDGFQTRFVPQWRN
jgi:hypothetical protein